MRTRITFIFGILSIVVICSGTGRAVLAAQDATQAATPTAPEVPRFAIVPVGDHPDGYFKDLEIEPGESTTLAVEIRNIGTVPVDLLATKVNALSGPNGGYLSGDPADEPLSATAWIDFPATDLHLEPASGQEISFTVTVPEDAESGQYISGLLVQTSDSLEIPGTDTLRQVIGSAITLSVLVPGELNESFELGDPSSDSGRIDIPVTNTGNYLVRPAGELTLKNDAGDAVLTAPIQMGSVYAGLSTSIVVYVPEQIMPGDYTMDLVLADPESGAQAALSGATLSIKEPADPTGVSVTSATVEPNAEKIAFANVDITLNNGGQQIAASNVTLEVMKDGEHVESFPLATNQVFLSGENTYTARYIPAEMWETGEYNFSIVVSAVDPNGGQETVLLNEELDARIVVP